MHNCYNLLRLNTILQSQCIDHLTRNFFPTHARQKNLPFEIVKHSLAYHCYSVTAFGLLLFEPLQYFFPFSETWSITRFLNNSNKVSLCKQHIKLKGLPSIVTVEELELLK